MTFKEAYDLKTLAEKYKAAGIPMAEEALSASTTIFLEWLKESATKSTEGFPGVADDVLASLIPTLQEGLKKVFDLNKDGHIGVKPVV